MTKLEIYNLELSARKTAIERSKQIIENQSSTYSNIFEAIKSVESLKLKNIKKYYNDFIVSSLSRINTMIQDATSDGLLLLSNALHVITTDIIGEKYEQLGNINMEAKEIIGRRRFEDIGERRLNDTV